MSLEGALSSEVYFLPGKGGSLGAGLGRGISDRGFEVVGRETRGAFRELDFEEKITAVSHDLKAGFWRDDALVIANSFGAYLFLHAQLTLPPFPGRVLLLSPIIGGSADPESGFLYSPPYADRVMKATAEGSFPAPRCLEIHVGSEDWQADPERVDGFGRRLGGRVVVASGRGHMLGADYVSPVLDRFLGATVDHGRETSSF